jgi:hypothetical protein
MGKHIGDEIEQLLNLHGHHGAAFAPVVDFVECQFARKRARLSMLAT